MLDVHKELAALIEMRDGAAARRLMDDHVKMIAARRVAEHRDKGKRMQRRTRLLLKQDRSNS